MGEARAIESAENGGEVLEEDALEVSVFWFARIMSGDAAKG